MNGLTPPKAGVTDWPPGGTPRAARGAPEPSEAFAGILDSHQARTATAEGHDKSPQVKGRDRRDDGPVANERAERRSNAEWARERRAADGTERERPAKTGDDATPTQPETPATTDTAPAETAGEAVTVVPEAPVAQPVVDATAAAVLAAVPATVATEAQVAPAAAPAPVQPQANTAPVAVVSQPAVVNPEAVAVPGEAVAAAATQADGVPAEVVVAAAKQAGQTQAADGKPQQPAQAGERPVLPAQANAQAASNPSQQQPDAGPKDPAAKHSQPGTLPAQAADQARTVAQAYGRVAEHGRQPAEAPVTQSNGTPVAAPVSNVQQPAGVSGQSQATPVPLARAAETVEHVLRLAASRGVTHARIALNPAELGSIDVHLRHTAEGLVAKVVAHSADAVVQLQQAANDLRRSLEEQGVNILNLDIGHSGDERSAGRAGSGAGDEGRGRDRGGDSVAGDSAADGEVTVKTNLQLPNGVLVDVLA